jgi:Tol biopolymer transport system component
MGIPISSGGWQISLDAVRTADSLEMGIYPNEATFTPNDGYAFLIIDMTIRSLDPTRAMDVSTDNVAILDANKTIHTADGGGWSDTYMCAGCSISLSRDVGASETSVIAIVRSGDNASINFSSISSEDPISFMFVVSSEELDQEWQLQFQDILMPFTLGDKAVYPLTTEFTVQNASLPQECQANNIQLAQTKAGLVYQEWADNTLTTKLAFPDESTPIELCMGFAYSALQIAPDGGLILKAGPLRGWANLYVIEPDGKVTSLVRNALAVNGNFVPDTKYIVFSVTQVGKEGEALYLYDREKGVTTLLYEGRWINHRIFPDGSLLVNGMPLETSERFEYMGPVGADKLPVLKLPDGTSSDDITPDGKYLLYTDFEGGTTHLSISNLDGSDKKEILSGDIPYGDTVLSPDGQYLLVPTQGTADNMRQASLYNVAAGSSQSITPDSDDLEYSFSPDGKWVVAISTFNREENDKAKTQKQTLYLFSMDNKKVVKEIQGEIVNYFFSPDNAFLAYTTKNEDETLNMFVVNLADLGEQPLGQGILTGWSKSVDITE